MLPARAGIACHSRQRSYRVTALDLNPDYLALAQRAAIAHGVELETVTADMRRIPFNTSFDAIINMYSSFGYLESTGDNLQRCWNRLLLRSSGKAAFFWIC